MPIIEGITCEHQQGKNWCWAATALCIMNHYRKYDKLFPLTQSELANKFTKGHDVTFDVFDVLESYEISNGTNPRTLPVKAITESIAANQPMILQLGPSIDMHFVVLIGYEKISGLDAEYILLDPLDQPPAPKRLNKNALGTIQGVQFTKAPPLPSRPGTRCPCPCVIM